ncbi:hypothetical protein DUNSADRAFT_1218 [Dunaliella salina]|uniref:Uncharacterized protein n=1 Tax=Dunaliella salina TaxID=3046 RepID=A0ABQ7GXE9_DUNSA|nr:hypothetical protein DUNSADRAFT_1218 [Dunaliella salina]|eukprot:KAF5839274.1 hypothetical protein DUNSADRAFT_1218 [Dunaliella salina]
MVPANCFAGPWKIFHGLINLEDQELLGWQGETVDDMQLRMPHGAPKYRAYRIDNQLSKAVAFVQGRGRDVSLPSLQECFFPMDNKQAWARPGGSYDEAMEAFCKELLPAMQHLLPPEEEAPPSRKTQHALKELETRWIQNFRVHVTTGHTACLVEGHLRVVNLGEAQAAKDAEYGLLDRERLVKLPWTPSWEGLTLGVAQVRLSPDVAPSEPAPPSQAHR